MKPECSELSARGGGGGGGHFLCRAVRDARLYMGYF